MKKNRKALFLHSDIIRGRYLKEDAPGGATGTPTPSPAPSNAATGDGNSSQSASGDSGNNNAGPAFDASTFWNSQDQDGTGSGDSQSASGDDSGSDTGLREELTQRLESLNFGDPVFSQEIMEAAQSGDYNGLNQALNGAMSHAVRQALGLSVSVLRPFAEQIMTQVRDEINQTMGQRDDSDQLVKDFPTAANPQIRPVVENLYKQALKNTKGDRPSAVQQVKEMMRLMSTSVADDIGLNVAPRGADDSGRPPARAVNWLDELSAAPGQ